ncbi:hypothetical protein Ae406Ps2_6351 [Pseudonocardia sp. Ae406_Ps2]|nr:hypothetical protein Ae331Ps2_6274 [Pseudonocardia sp. Ae331_Ps2]OLL89911.1 hypothetical protein Ae406Ps2_6351 [Pseudonocardia sp. Ae406_Ps2]
MLPDVRRPRVGDFFSALAADAALLAAFPLTGPTAAAR